MMIYKVTFMNGELISSVLGYSTTQSETIKSLYEYTGAKETLIEDLGYLIQTYTEFQNK